MASGDTDYDINLFDYRQSHAMWDQMAEMRERCPVARLQDGLKYTARYTDVQRVFRDSQHFVTKGGFRAPGVEIPEDELLMAEMDPPGHPPLRKALLGAFNIAVARSAEEFARQFVEGRLAGIDAAGRGDLVAEISVPLPIAVTTHVLGVPTDDIQQIADWVFALLHTDWPAYGVRDHTRPEEHQGLSGSAPELCSYFDAMIADRVDNDRQDLISEMLRIEVDGEKLRHQRVRTLALNFITGGISTTMLISNLLHRLLTDDSLADTLRRQPDLIPVAVEESLRVEPPVLFLCRTATQTTEIGGVTIEAGDRVVAGIASANRDETVYPDAATFSLDRDHPPTHLAFGGGAHLCLGNKMARMEAAVVIETVFAHYRPGELRLAPDFHYELMPHFIEFGPERLDVVVDR
ncbi:MAG TPA: cytochrome P450 [Acidimicrobiales bacterium]|nr:cytochrome P450 [Acidimicrobiales bacterium]